MKARISDENQEVQYKDKDEEIQEAKQLRWLARQFPFFKNPKDNGEKMSNAIFVYANEGANKKDPRRRIRTTINN